MESKNSSGIEYYNTIVVLEKYVLIIAKSDSTGLSNYGRQKM